jgi:hypothetical protein
MNTQQNVVLLHSKNTVLLYITFTFNKHRKGQKVFG